jgi:hypothetical protein
VVCPRYLFTLNDQRERNKQLWCQRSRIDSSSGIIPLEGLQARRQTAQHDSDRHRVLPLLPACVTERIRFDSIVISHDRERRPGFVKTTSIGVNPRNQV